MQKLYKTLCRIELVLCGTGFILMILVVLLSAILRFFRLSMSWNIDVALILMAWTAFLGADIAWREGSLFGIDIITRRLPPIAQKLVELFIYIIILSALIIIIISGSKLAWMEKLRKYQSIPIPFSFVIMSLATAAFFMAFSTLLKIKRCIMSFRQISKGEKAK